MSPADPADDGELPAATRRFLAEARRTGLEVEPVVYPEGTRTAADAAAAIGCEEAAIVKSMLFMAGERPVLVLMAGDRRVDTTRLAAACGTDVTRRASLDEVRRHTGYAAGGTPPIGHPAELTVLADVSLRRNDPVWAAAGTPTTVFSVPPETLADVAGATWVDVGE